MQLILPRMPAWIAVAACAVLGAPVVGQEPIRLGIVGLDTSHVVAFTAYLNNPANDTGCRVVVGYPGGSPDMPASIDRVGTFTATLREKHGVEIVDSVEALCGMVDGVLLESLDGRVHLEQARALIAAKKPFFVDKPVAHDLGTIIEIFALAREQGVPCWSASSFRYGEGIASARENADLGKIIGCDVFGSSSWTQFHPDLYLYGIHAVEALFTVMGPGCQTVRRVKTPGTDLVVGVWPDGRIGTFRDVRDAKTPGVAIVYGTQSSAFGKSSGYNPLLREIVTFFKTKAPPLPADETIEIYGFMSAADASRDQGGAAISLPEFIAAAREAVSAKRR
ncbi:MAG: Gfo/Idh/MocA family protein [Planctomycetia bacterium]